MHESGIFQLKFAVLIKIKLFFGDYTCAGQKTAEIKGDDKEIDFQLKLPPVILIDFRLRSGGPFHHNRLRIWVGHLPAD